MSSAIMVNGVVLHAPEWITGNEPEYSRADLHFIDAALAGASELAAKRPALIDVVFSADKLRGRVLQLETENAALRRIIDEDERRDELDNGQFGVGA